MTTTAAEEKKHALPTHKLCDQQTRVSSNLACKCSPPPPPPYCNTFPRCDMDCRICIAPATIEDRGRITRKSSVCMCGVPEQKCIQLATKSSGRPQQLQLCRQPVPCSRCGDTEKVLSPIRRRVRGTTRSPDDEARSADRSGTSATDDSKSEMYSGVCLSHI